MTTLALALALLQADPAQLADCPWPKHSHAKIPWRAWSETRPAADFLRGIGVVYNVRDNDELAVRLLAEAGVRAVRREVGWGSVTWDENALGDEKRFRSQLRLFKAHGMRPTFLLNCHQGQPCPVRFFEATLSKDAPKGAVRLKLDGVTDFVPGRTGLSGLTDYWAAEVLLTGLDAATGEYSLAKPLPKDLKAGRVPMATLKYLPLHLPTTPEFAETAAGWVRYATLVAKIAVEEGVDDFDFEIYNELTFGTRFLDIRHYRPDYPEAKADLLHEGGILWELGKRIVDGVRKDYPKARFIWGFSNTTFFHTAPERLPAGIDGQSYHPYGTGTRNLRKQEPHRDQPALNLEGKTPDLDVRIPEGVASTLIQTESIMRLIEPAARAKKPGFAHYITEHGVLAAECGVTDEAGAWALKTRCSLRSWSLWLHKGVEVLHYYSAWYEDSRSFGLLPTDLAKLPADARFDDVATPPLRALRNLTRAFAGAKPVKPTALDLRATPAGDVGRVHEGLGHADVLAVLPWQLDESTYAVIAYVATWDALKPMAEERYRIAAPGVEAVRLVDPVAGRELPFEKGGEGAVVPLSDLPRVLILKRR